MKEKVETAVLNNIVWCGMVCDTHGIAQSSNEHVWGLLSKAPAFYPDVITISKHATVDLVKDFIAGKEISSVKDCFANLDLTSLGFKILFEAEWIYHEPSYHSNLTHSDWHVITTERELAEWAMLQGLEHVILPDLLKREEVKIFKREKKGEIAGFIANMGANTVGISNVFSTDKKVEKLWSDITKVAATEFPELPMVGYEQGGNLTAAILSGWTSIGPLLVWLKASFNS